MELKFDLFPKRKKSKFTFVMGVIGIALAILSLILILHEKKGEGAFYWINMINMLVYGILCIIFGLGYSPEKLFGSAYVHIDDRHIAIKSGIRAKEQSIDWSQIKSMEYKTNWFHITLSDGSTSKFSLSDLEFRALIEARDAIQLIAAEKGIAII